MIGKTIKVDFYDVANINYVVKVLSENDEEKYIECKVLDKINTFGKTQGDFYNYGQRNFGYKTDKGIITAYLCEVTKDLLNKNSVGTIIEIFPIQIVKIIKT